MATLETLQPPLRRLKLSGMLDAIPARVEEARAHQLDPLDFLKLDRWIRCGSNVGRR
jgi:hypothetical protein